MKRTKHHAKQSKQKQREDSDYSNLDSNSDTNTKPNRRGANKELEHRHKFNPAVVVDWQGYDTYFGVCDCGETEV